MSKVITFRPIEAERIKLRFSVSEGHPGIVDNVEWTWRELAERLRKSYKDPYTLEEFRSLTEDQQLRRKNNGYFCGAQFEGGRRRKQNMLERMLIAFDLDDCPQDLLEALKGGTSGLGDVEYVIYSTRKHSFPNNIRLRIVLPLAVPLAHDKFKPVARILASKLDPSMQAVDKVSFTAAQFMYWPSHCSDVKPFYYWNKSLTRDVIDADAILEEYGDWKDFNRLPRSAREGELRRTSEKMANPLEKRGVVGAFCRTFNVHEAIAEFIPDIYRQTEGDRYTYIPGTTANGCVVYDDGNAFFSHHGTDPASDRSNNSFDLVRIHRFGHLDKDADDDTRPTDMPSYKAMAELLMGYPDVQQDLRNENYTEEDIDEVFDDLVTGYDNDTLDNEIERSEVTSRLRKAKEDEAAKTGTVDPDMWKLDLDTNSDGIIKPGLPNLLLILRHGLAFKGRFAFDEFRCENVVLKPIRSKRLGVSAPGPNHMDPMGRFSERHLHVIRLILEAHRDKGGWGMAVSDRDLEAAHQIVSQENRVHPVREYLDGLAWDGVPRIDEFWIRACHTPDTPYFRETARLWLTAAPARVYEPGCKFDFCPIIEGPQGLFKSSLLIALGGAWATEITGHFDNPQKLVEKTLGYWIVEIPELVQFSKAEVAQIKATITEQAAKGVRLAYARLPGYFPRQFIFAGTTNDETYLRDTTGNRRFWPIPCGPGQIDLEWVEKNRDQIWAEATHSYREMRKAKPVGNLPLYLKGTAGEEATSAQAARVVDDGSQSAAGLIAYWLETPVPVSLSRPGATAGDFTENHPDEELVLRKVTCGREIFLKALDGKRDGYDQRAAQVVGRAMKLVSGWVTGKMARCGEYGRQRTFVRKGTETTSEDDLDL